MFKVVKKETVFSVVSVDEWKGGPERRERERDDDDDDRWR